MEYNVCKTCGANDGRAGYLINDECVNCHTTRLTREVHIINLNRTEEELQKTMDILTDGKPTLLPCPFCGKEAVDRNWRYQDSEFMQHGSIGCDSCGIAMNWSDIRTEQRHDTHREIAAIAKWGQPEQPI